MPEGAQPPDPGGDTGLLSAMMTIVRRFTGAAVVAFTFAVGVGVARIGWWVERGASTDSDRVEFQTSQAVAVDLDKGDRLAIYAQTYPNEFFGLDIDFDYWPEDYTCTAEPSGAAISPAKGVITKRAIDGDYQWMRVAYIEVTRTDRFSILCMGHFDGPMAVASAEPMNYTSANLGSALVLGGVLIATLGSIMVSAVLLVRWLRRRNERPAAPTASADRKTTAVGSVDLDSA